MIPFQWLNALFFWIISGLVFKHTLQRWHNPHKKFVRYSEIIQGILFLVMGYYALTLVSPISELNVKFHQYLFGIYAAITFLFLGMNVLPNAIKKWRDPTYRENISYHSFLESLQLKYANQEQALKADKVKDLSRKLLHLIQFTGFLGVHALTTYFTDDIETLGLSALEMRNFIYLIAAGFFWIMLMTGDLTRLEHWEYLPKWAWKWYEKSLEPSREIWTFNAATTIILANITWIHPSVPVQVLLTAAWISCISDGFASIIGKNFGVHKIARFGFDHNKSYEGLMGGIISTFVGILLIFSLYPIPTFPVLAILIIATANSVVFALTDLYSRYVTDNILNSLIPGILTWLVIILFSA